MKVSVVIPTYNRARYLPTAIDSVLSQTYTDIELIVIDDGSTDDTKEVLEKYKDRITYRKIINSGPAIARNTGMQMATGEYIAYLDSDDSYYPHKIALQTAFLDQYRDAGMVYTEFSGFDDNKYFDYRHLKKYHKSAYQTGALSYSDIFTKQFPVSDYYRDSELGTEMTYMGNIFDSYLYNTVVFTNSMMFRRDILDQTGLQSTEFGFFHDLEFALRICKFFTVGFIDVPTYKLRYHPEQVSTLDAPDSSSIAAKLQNDLLKVTEFHGKQNTSYYKQNKNRVDRQLAKLSRSVAIPLLDYQGDDRRARHYLAQCKHYGRPEYVLWILSYMPHIVRRVGFKLLDIQKNMTIRLRMLSRTAK